MYLRFRSDYKDCLKGKSYPIWGYKENSYVVLGGKYKELAVPKKYEDDLYVKNMGDVGPIGRRPCEPYPIPPSQKHIFEQFGIDEKQYTMMVEGAIPYPKELLQEILNNPEDPPFSIIIRKEC